MPYIQLLQNVEMNIIFTDCYIYTRALSFHVKETVSKENFCLSIDLGFALLLRFFMDQRFA